MNRISGVVSMFILLAFSGCDIFPTRDPEPPTQGTSSYQIPDRPEIVLENLRSAFTEVNADNYIRSFSDTSANQQQFIFIPSTDVGSVYSSVFRGWSASDERNYFQNLGKPDNGTPQLTFANLVQSFNTSDSAIFTMDYSLFYPHHRQNVPQLVRGKMEIHLKPDSHRLWSIQTWYDFKTAQDSTWSYLKAVFSAN